MADDELDWDAEDYAPPDLKLKTEYGEEIIKKLDEDEEKKAAEAAAAAAAASQQKQSKDKAKKDKKLKEKTELQAPGTAEAKPLTPQELENIQRASDLAAAAEMLGVSNSVSVEESIDHFEPKSKEDFDKLIHLLSKKLGYYQKNENYHDFLSQLFTEFCVKLDSEHIRRYGRELTALGAEKLKEEKEREKAKQPKAKKKPTLGQGRLKGNDLDDVVDTAQGGFDFGDDEDFM